MVNDDAELLARIRNGATDDFAEIVRGHQSRVFAILHCYERDTHRLEDLAQETFVKVWRALDQYAEDYLSSCLCVSILFATLRIYQIKKYCQFVLFARAVYDV